jgi:hypothetical protein
MASVMVAGLMRTARGIQKPVSLAAAALLILYLIFSQIIGKMQNVDPALPAIVNWIGAITLVAVVMSITSYVLPLFLSGRSGALEVGAPKITNPGTKKKAPPARGGAGT